MPENANDILFRLEALLHERKRAEPGSSYVASLYAKGLDAVLKKVGEEATEAILAAKGDNAAVIKNSKTASAHAKLGIEQTKLPLLTLVK